MGEGVTIYDVRRLGSDRSRRELPRIVAGALRLVWAAGRRELATVLALEALGAIGLAGLVLLGREVLSSVLEADRIRELFAARSVLLISHRFSTVRAADRIYVLDDGRIVEAGSHAELMVRGGAYAELFGLQAAAYAG